MNRALILMYHQVDTPLSERERRFCTPPDEFARQMEALVEGGFTPLSLDETLACLRGQASWPSKAVHVTFDDGFTGVLEHALPVLQRLSIPATLFAVSDRLGMDNDWMHSRGFPKRDIMTGDQIKALRAGGMTIGSHTRSHVRLTEISAEAVADEVRTSKQRIEDLLGEPVHYFAYPYGLQDGAVRNAVENAGYLAACSTRSGFNRPGEDLYLLRRIDVFGTDRLWQFRQKLHFGHNETSRFYPIKYYAGRLGARLGLPGLR